MLMKNRITLKNEEKKLNSAIPIPLHYQLSEILREEIRNRHLVGKDGKVPTEAELSKRFNVSRITVRTALQSLVDEGLLTRERGRGTFLKNNQPENWAGQLMGYAETIEKAGFKAGGKVIYKQFIDHLSNDISETLQSESGWELKRLRYADNLPIAIEHSFFLPEIGEELEKQQNLDELLIYQFIERNLEIKIDKAKQLISATNVDENDAKLLNILEGSALLYVERITKATGGKPIEYLHALYHPNYFNYVIDLNRV